MSAQRPVYLCPGCKAQVQFGTVSAPPPNRCPNCQRRLYIPTNLEQDSLIEVTCSNCSEHFLFIKPWRHTWRYTCSKCGSPLNLPTDP